MSAAVIKTLSWELSEQSPYYTIKNTKDFLFKNEPITEMWMGIFLSAYVEGHGLCQWMNV